MTNYYPLIPNSDPPSVVTFPNDGYIVGMLDKKLFKSLLEEVSHYENNEEFITGVRDCNNEQTCPHYELGDTNKENLNKFLLPYVVSYAENFGYVNSINILDRPSTYSFGDAWFNIQKPEDYLSGHVHDGLLSYTLWLKLPPKSELRFLYNSVTGRLDNYDILLTPKDEGKFILFPSTLFHAVHPYKSNKPNELRISLAGNVMLKGPSK